MVEPWQPDRSRGIFETLLVVDSEPVELEAHLTRLARSLESLYSHALPPRAEEKLWQAAEEIDLGWLRLTVVPAEDDLGIDLLTGGVDWEAVLPTDGVKLRSFPLPGGLGHHKWADRRGINRPGPTEAGALIVDEGEALEAGWANAFAVRGGTLFTPPLDGRLLPGTTRAVILDLAASEGINAREEPLRPTDLRDADETFLTGSIRGIEPAEELDGQPLAGCGEISRRLCAALRRSRQLQEPPVAAVAPKPDPLSR